MSSYQPPVTLATTVIGETAITVVYDAQDGQYEVVRTAPPQSPYGGTWQTYLYCGPSACEAFAALQSAVLDAVEPSIRAFG